MAIRERELARELRELIAALDGRVPRVERAGEAAIARDAAALRAKAVKRLAELERAAEADVPPRSPRAGNAADAETAPRTAGLADCGRAR